MTELHTPEPIPLESRTWNHNFEFTSVKCHLTGLESLVSLTPIKCWLSVLFFFFFFPFYLLLTMLYVWIKYENYPLFNLLPTYLKQVCVVASVWWLRSWLLWLLSACNKQAPPHSWAAHPCIIAYTDLTLSSKLLALGGQSLTCSSTASKDPKDA